VSREYAEDFLGEDELLAEIFREFRQGLPERVEQIRASLEVLAEGYDRQAAELFYRTAHTLKGTAPSFGAHELVEPATVLTEVGKRWYEEGSVNLAELAAVRGDLELLNAAVERYASGSEGDASE
jgi:chemotaxis protein histidine kinase CheA